MKRLIREGGFSLVELMVALAIGSVLLLALATLFINTSSARAEIDKSSRQIESGRYAMQVLSDDIRHAGYYGPLINAPTNVGALTALPDPCVTTAANIQNSAFLPLQGYAGAANSGALGLSCIASAAGYKPNTGVIVVRRIDTTVSTAPNAPTANYFNIQASGCAGDPAPYVLNTDAAGPYTLHSNGAPGCTPITSAPLANVSPYYTRIYFVSTCSGSDCSAAGADTVPTLKRIDIHPGSTTITPIVDGIENVQFDYGIDTTAAPGDGVPDIYTNTTAHAATTPAFAEWQNVMTVRVYLLARNLDPSGGFRESKTYPLGPVSVSPTDNYRRHAYNELVRLNNPSGRRE